MIIKAEATNGIDSLTEEQTVTTTSPARSVRSSPRRTSVSAPMPAKNIPTSPAQGPMIEMKETEFVEDESLIEMYPPSDDEAISNAIGNVVQNDGIELDVKEDLLDVEPVASVEPWSFESVLASMEMDFETDVMAVDELLPECESDRAYLLELAYYQKVLKI
jgi:hypothetical protein